MRPIVLHLEHSLRRLDDNVSEGPTPLGFVVDVLVFVIPAVVVALSGALAAYFFG
jgi:hypothetical protein